MVWGVWLIHRSHPSNPDSIIISRNTIPACNKPCNNFLLQKIITSASKIITLGFVLDLGAQEEFDDNFWCCVKLRCSTLYFSTSETCRFGFWGSVTPKSSLVSPNRTKMDPEGQTKHLQMVWGVWVIHRSHPSIFLAPWLDYNFSECHTCL